MTFSPIGDLSFGLQTAGQTTRLKTRLQNLSLELSSGTRSDLTASLGPQQRDLLDIDGDLARLDGYETVASETSLRLGGMQMALSAVEALRVRLGEQLLLPGDTPDDAQIATAAAEGQAAFIGVVSQLNHEQGGRFSFAGQAWDTPPLPDGASFLATVEAAAATALTAGDILALVDNAAGPFATTLAAVDTQSAIATRVGVGRDLEVGVTAADAGPRAALRAALIGALAGDPSLALDRSERTLLLREAGVAALGAAAPLVQTRATIGRAEGALQEAQVANAAARTVLSTARNDLTQADPFETASALQAVQQSLELHFAATARLSRLSLANYL